MVILNIGPYFAVTFKLCYLLFEVSVLKVAEYVAKERPSPRAWHVVERAHAIGEFSTHQAFQFSERIEEPNQGCND